jgi:hypothetical protein
MRKNCLPHTINCEYRQYFIIYRVVENGADDASVNLRRAFELIDNITKALPE